ncbi:hypothetical protein AGABI1DRAFT_113016 [Agaricus bisporus var. burnettii JB137-S8]|uniref:Uncharacterized protein n=1 Tax=Agaricus bisporus var. burnettii (strain JB137-S8 / ATCC MYA-4627 / FGSC 10392) TaxID=597362 RepID=K5X0M5_AGABU|nr:uncharacterized protein AGABI1DRAFT_113016 [Agaricus bisporus var. burnettii JB137-S8]EKM81361.1 hypothetical protein AGABI1DRAFT_113016 [Agaricus bisporus var. burnettii JB137-S8]
MHEMSDIPQPSYESPLAETKPEEHDEVPIQEKISTAELQLYLRQIRQLDLQSKSESRELRKEISHLDKKLKDRESQRRKLREISKELELAQKFLSTADSLSQADAVREMERLNEEILQLTSIMAYEYLQIGEKKLPTKKGQGILLRRSPLIRNLGGSINLIMAENLVDTSAIQIGWQSILVNWCSNLIQEWVLEHMGFDFDSCFLNMYQHISSKNDPAIARRWRSIIYGVTNDVAEKKQRALVRKVLQALADLPVLWGYVFDQGVYNFIYKEFRRRIGPIIEQCFILRAMLGHDIASTEIRPYLIASGTKYNPEYADLYEDGLDEMGEELGGAVACSTTLGLRCITRSRNSDGGFEEKTELILKPRIILLGMLKTIIL